MIHYLNFIRVISCNLLTVRLFNSIVSDGHIERCKKEEELGVKFKDVPMVQPLNDVPTRLRRTSDMILATCQRISNLALL